MRRLDGTERRARRRNEIDRERSEIDSQRYEDECVCMTMTTNETTELERQCTTRSEKWE